MPDLTTLGFAGSQNALFTPDEVEQLMRVEFERAQRYRYAVSCMVVRVDRLEQLHTVHGFDSKAEVMQRVVELVRSATRAGDLLGYLLEDRLVCVFPHTGAPAARGLADRLLRSTRDLIFQAGHTSLRITLSVGLSHNQHPEEVGFDTLRRVAEEGLAVAEAAGGDRWSETELYGLYEAQHQRQAAQAGPKPMLSLPEDLVGGYREALERMVAQDGDLEAAVGQLVEGLMERAMSEARTEMEEELRNAEASGAPADPEQEVAYQREIELLRRRVNKLTESLGLTEQELVKLRQLKDVDSGLESVYRDVQGLDLEDARAEIKKQLMASIFEANLDLQRSRPQAG